MKLALARTVEWTGASVNLYLPARLAFRWLRVFGGSQDRANPARLRSGASWPKGV